VTDIQYLKNYSNSFTTSKTTYDTVVFTSLNWWFILFTNLK